MQCYYNKLLLTNQRNAELTVLVSTMAWECGLEEFTFFDSWLSKEDADSFLKRFLSDIPWAPKKWNLVYTLPQLAFYYDEKARRGRPIAVLEELVGRIEREFRTRASVVWCNLFESGKHYIDWHQDQYGEHLFVPSFGATRSVVFRHKKTKEVKEYACKHGDLYYFCPEWDNTHEHCIPMDESVQNRRVSFAIFTQPPNSVDS